MARLGVNIDHIATLRQARGGREPDPLTAAGLVELAGADGLVVHLREDRRHIQDRDFTLLKEISHTKLNLEMAADEGVAKIALNVKPDMATLVPERRQELTTEGGLAVTEQRDRLQTMIQLLHDGGIPVVCSLILISTKYAPPTRFKPIMSNSIQDVMPIPGD